MFTFLFNKLKDLVSGIWCFLAKPHKPTRTHQGFLLDLQERINEVALIAPFASTTYAIRSSLAVYIAAIGSTLASRENYAGRSGFSGALPTLEPLPLSTIVSRYGKFMTACQIAAVELDALVYLHRIRGFGEE